MLFPLPFEGFLHPLSRRPEPQEFNGLFCLYKRLETGIGASFISLVIHSAISVSDFSAPLVRKRS